MVSINLAPAMSVVATGQDGNFETRLNAIENAIFKLKSTLENFISTNIYPGKLQRENDRGCLTDFSVNASHYEIDQSSDKEINCCPPPQKKPKRNAVNVDICRASEDVFDKEINLLVPEKQDQSRKENSEANNLALFEKIDKK